MKVKVLKSFVSGRVSGEKGQLIDVPEARASKLVKAGIVEATNEKGNSAPLTASQTAETAPEDKIPAEKKTTAKSAKSGGKSTGKK